MLTSKKKMATLMGSKGISNDTLVIAYDTNKMNASRLLWSLFMYGHENVKVVDGGLEAIKAAGIILTTEEPVVTETTFEVKEPSQNWLATKKDVLEVGGIETSVVAAFIKENKIKWKEDQSLLKVGLFLNEKLNAK